MKKFTNQDVANYYDQTEVHYRMWWKMEDSMGLHYGIWDSHTNKLRDAILNTNKMLIEMGNIKSTDHVLDAGCGVGGSSIYLAKNIGCKATGITLSKKQANTATGFAEKAGVSHLANFQEKDYTKTGFENNSFDIVWAIESMQTAQDKNAFFKEASRVLKSGGRIVIADCFKTFFYDIDTHKEMGIMLNGWAMSDLLTIEEIKKLAKQNGLHVKKIKDVNAEIKKSVQAIYRACAIGMIGTKLYNLYRNATPFSKIHYKTGLAQSKAYKKGLWDYQLLVIEKL